MACANTLSAPPPAHVPAGPLLGGALLHPGERRVELRRPAAGFRQRPFSREGGEERAVNLSLERRARTERMRMQIETDPTPERSPVRLTLAQRFHFDAYGYVLLKNVLAPDEISRMKAA